MEVQRKAKAANQSHIGAFVCTTCDRVVPGSEIRGGGASRMHVHAPCATVVRWVAFARDTHSLPCVGTYVCGNTHQVSGDRARWNERRNHFRCPCGRKLAWHPTD